MLKMPEFCALQGDPPKHPHSQTGFHWASLAWLHPLPEVGVAT